MNCKSLLKENTNIPSNIKYMILSHILNKNMTEIIQYEENLTKNELRKYHKIIKKYEKNKPIQYILKQAYFYDDFYYVNKNVLIPRPETENLVLETTKLIKEHFAKDITICDIGTGSGVIAITLKKIFPKSKLIALDISEKAIKVAKKNAHEKNISINFMRSDILNNVKQKCDVIISNPPYIDKKDQNIESIVKNNEPEKALFAKDNGLYFYKEILKQSKNILNKKNIIAFEIGATQKDAIIKEIQKYYPDATIIAKKDYNDFDRYIFIINE